MAVGGSKANGKIARSVIRGQARRLRGFMKSRRREEEEKKGTQRCKGAKTQREERGGMPVETLNSIGDLAVGFGGS
jgi:hypothetical protein